MSASCFACRGALAPTCLRFARSRSIRERRWQASRSGGAGVQRRGWAEDGAGAGPGTSVAQAVCHGRRRPAGSGPARRCPASGRRSVRHAPARRSASGGSAGRAIGHGVDPRPLSSNPRFDCRHGSNRPRRARAPCRGPGGQPQGRCRRPLPPFGVGSVRAEMLSTDGFGPSQATETAPDIGPHTPGRAHRATPVRQVVWGPWRSAIPARAAHHPARPVRLGRLGRQKRCDGGPREARQRAASMRPFSFR